ncbi:hypothetical protein C8R47DRAFT_1151819 [Mycena vitilis]|nr:hypothetical protein C8R47DRAFT_1151819 [Mycena vitilis]
MAYAMAHFALPGMHTAMIDPVKWNSDWENLGNRVQRMSPADFIHTRAMLLATESDGMDASLLQYQSLLGGLSSLQLWITKDAQLYFVRDDLENKWLSADPALRGKHILIGLSSACAIARNLHDARIYCARELRLARLKGDGRIIMGWLKAIMVPEDPQEALKLLEKPRYLPDAAWDACADLQRRSSPSDSEKLALGEILTLRTKLICHFLHATIRSFVGEELPKIDVVKFNKKKNPESFPSAEYSETVMEQLLGRDGAKANAKENKAAWKARQSTRHEYCSYVGCRRPEVGPEKFSRCKKCWEQKQREVLYCSAACQKADWKANHKAICGKALNFDAVSKPKLTGLGPSPAELEPQSQTPESVQKRPQPSLEPAAIPAPAVSVIGPPAGNYTRSSLLEDLVKKLNRAPKIDYIFADALDPICIDFPDPEAQSLFRKCREKAMTTGDRQSIAVMAHFLCWMTMEDQRFVGKGATPNVIVAQLKKEYSFDELPLAVAEMQQRQNRDPFKRPVLLSSMSPQNWVKFCSDIRVRKQVILK